MDNLFFDDTTDKKILRPKARRIIPNGKNNRHKVSSNKIINISNYKSDNTTNKEKLSNLEAIPLEEIDKDFMKLHQINHQNYFEEQLFFNEIMNIFLLSDIRKENSENIFKKSKKSKIQTKINANKFINIINKI